MRRVVVILLFAAMNASAGTIDTFIDLTVSQNNGLKSLMAYTWTTSLFEFDPKSFDVYQEIPLSGTAYSVSTSALSYSHNLLGPIDPTPPICYQATMSVTVHFIVSSDEFYSKVSNQVCYQGPPPPPPPPPGPIGGCETDCGSSWNPEPLVLDLNGDGIHTTGPEDRVWFDLDGNGADDHITWTDRGTMEGFLWIDLGGRNRVDNGAELFGIGTVLPDGTKARDGFEALANYDRTPQGGNGDGVIDARDDAWTRLRVWVDSNHDGIATLAR